MQWSMPRSVLKIVAALIGVTAVGSFALGVATAPHRGRLPGQRETTDGAVALEATDAQPLAAERIEGPPPPVELTEEEKAKLEAAKAKAEADKAAAEVAKLEAAKSPTPPPAAVAPAAPPTDGVGDILDKVAPKPKAEEPVF